MAEIESFGLRPIPESVMVRPPREIIVPRRKARHNIYNKIAKMVEDYVWYEFDHYIHFVNLPAKVLVEIAKIVPRDNLENRQNNAPSFKDFVEIAKKFPEVMFEGYLILGREDERITIDGIIIPYTVRNVEEVLEIIKKTEYEEADEFDMLDDGLRLWWD